MKEVYIIGDVHGCYKTLMALVKKLPKKATLCFVGDFVDRGNDSSKVIEFIKSNDHYTVIGNHELAMIEVAKEVVDFTKKDMKNNYWTSRYGGDKTLYSYKNRKKFLEDVKWVDTLPQYVEFKGIKDKNGRYLVVSHSSVHTAWKNKDSKNSIDKEDLTTHALCSRIQNPYDNKEIFNVFGHTIGTNPLIAEHFANIDTGCVYHEDKRYGNLTALEFPSKKIIQQKYIG